MTTNIESRKTFVQVSFPKLLLTSQPFFIWKCGRTGRTEFPTSNSFYFQFLTPISGYHFLVIFYYKKIMQNVSLFPKFLLSSLLFRPHCPPQLKQPHINKGLPRVLGNNWMLWSLNKFISWEKETFLGLIRGNKGYLY